MKQKLTEKILEQKFTVNFENLRSFYMGYIVYCKEVQKQQTQRQTILKNKLLQTEELLSHAVLSQKFLPPRSI